MWCFLRGSFENHCLGIGFYSTEKKSGGSIFRAKYILVKRSSTDQVQGNFQSISRSYDKEGRGGLSDSRLMDFP